MKPDTRRRSSLLVLAVTATAVTLAATVPLAGAVSDDLDDGVEGVELTTTSALPGPLGDVVDEGVAVLEDTGVVSTTTTSTSTTTTSSTTTTTTTTTTVPPRDGEEPAATDAPAAVGAERVLPTEALDEVAETVAEVVAPAQAPAAVPEWAVPQFELDIDAVADRPITRGPRSTTDVVDTLADLGASPELMARILAPFPVLGPATYTDDWHAPRHGGRRHLGVDVFAPRGTPVIAAADGVVSRMTTTAPLGGTSLRLTMADGTYFYYAHLDRFAEGLHEGKRVAQGQVLGAVGNTGNAIHTLAHLHFQVHPRGGEAVPPVPYLDRWLAEARQRVEAMGRSDGTQALLRAVPRPVPVEVPVQASGLRSPRIDTALTGRTGEEAPSMLALLAMAGAAGWAIGRVRRRGWLPRVLGRSTR